ncbi:MAG: hypothetical protein HY276_12510 [Ignavibacteriales bacterium]|nr:hypothetical protein [Ignavibacteriales bacterium]
MKNCLLLCCVLFLTAQSFAQLRWRFLPNAPFTSGKLDDIFFINPNTGWVTADRGTIYKTTDGGRNWQIQFNNGNTGHFRSIGFADSAHGWVGALGNANILFQTSDGGITWNKVTNLPSVTNPGGVCGISVVNASVVYCVGWYGGPNTYVFKTSNGGASWQAIDMTQYFATLVDCRFFSPDSGYIVGGVGTGQDLSNRKARILFTSDGGTTWQIRYTGTRSGEWCWKLFFTNRTTGYASIEPFSTSQPGYYLKTVNGGIS